MQSASLNRALTLLAAVSLCLAATAQKPASPGTSTPGKPSNDAALEPVMALVQQGHLAEAKTAMLAELYRHPSNVDGYILLGIIETHQQDYSHALEALERALLLAPNSTKAHNSLGNLYVGEKKEPLAEKEFRTVLRLDPANQDANYNLGVLLLAKGSAADAIPHFEHIKPATTASRFNLIDAMFKINRTAEALRLASDLSAEHKEEVAVHVSLGILLGTQKQYKPAELELELADALKPSTFEILYNLGLVYQRSGDSAKAQLSLDRALKLKPDSPEALYLQAEIYSSQSRPLDALDLLVRGHKIAPENTDILYLMAQISISQNYFEDAIPLLELALQLAPRRADLRATLGESYFMAGKVDKAIDQFNQLIALDPSARSYAYLGLSYRNLGRFDEARQNFQKGLKLDPHNSSCLFSLGYIAARQGDAASADTYFHQTLQYNPDYADALLELANLRISSKQLPEAEDLLRQYVKLSRTPSSGYYKLAMVERSLHENTAAERDLNVFKTYLKDDTGGPHPYEHLFDYLDNRARLAPQARQQLDITELTQQAEQHPDQPENLYLLAEAYLKSGKRDQARETIAQLDKLSASDYRTQTGTGVLLARYHLYDDAISHFQSALTANPDSDEVKFDLANAQFRKGTYRQALDTTTHISEAGRKDNAYLALLGDIYAHLGDANRASEILHDAIARNPDNDQDYLSLALLQLRQKDVPAARRTLERGQTRIPGSGKLLWGLGIVSALEGKTTEAADNFEHAVELLPEWPGSYSTLGVFYYETGQIDKAKEVLDRFKNSNAAGALDINRIAQTLAQAPTTSSSSTEPMTAANREQLLQLALSLADRTL